MEDPSVRERSERGFYFLGFWDTGAGWSNRFIKFGALGPEPGLSMKATQLFSFGKKLKRQGLFHSHPLMFV